MASLDLPEAVWKFLLWNAYLSEKHRLLYVSTPKVACTSLKWWFAALEGYSKALSEFKESGESDPELMIHDSFHKVAPHIAGLGPEKLAPALVSADYFRFAVVRNPYQRVFSAWQSKLLLREPLQSGPYLEYDFFRYPIRNAADIRAGFEGFLEHLAFKEAPEFLDYHWTPQADLLRPDLISYTKLSQIENISELSKVLAEHLGPHVLNPFTSRKANESLLSYSRDFLTDRAAELIQMLYARDFEIFGYESSPPSSKKEYSTAELDIALRSIDLIRARHQALTNTRGSLYGRIQQLNEKVNSELTKIQELNRTVSQLNQSVSARDREITGLRQNLASVSRTLNEIRNSTAWSIALRITRMGAILFPHGTRRERMARSSIGAIRTWRREGSRAALQKTSHKIQQIARNRLQRISPPALARPDWKRDEPYVPISEQDVDPVNVVVRTIAFYLPQFHPIPENDAWWGKGFTEWTNVSKAAPNFSGHYQPHLPGELGFYDLRLPEVQRRQVELAKKYGVYGFCFYYYWFSGKRLLERPLNQYLANPELDFPFCLCWANENWTRRWDGLENEILISQTHNEQEYLHFIQDISTYLKDPRYIRVDGKPMLLVYRINQLPDPQRAVQLWREESRRLGIGDLYLVAVQSFGVTDPRPYGFDAAVEFPPLNLKVEIIDRSALKITNPQFAGRVFDYNKVAQDMIAKPVPDYTLFKTVMPSWDNTARRQNESVIAMHATPSAYKSWLEKVVSYTQTNLPEEKRFVFVNAWNEWAEGTHLEPDRRYGYGYLQATADAIQSRWKILFVSHDAGQAGAQADLLHILAWYKQHTSHSIKVLCLEGGPWLSRFAALADTVVLSELSSSAGGDAEKLTQRLLSFCDGRPDLIYGNTVVAGKAYPWLATLGVPILTHVHELEQSIHRYAAGFIEDILKYSSHYIACSKAVKENLIKNHAIEANKISVVYEFIQDEKSGEAATQDTKLSQRRRLGLVTNKTIVLGCGVGMPFRKGADLFIQLGEILCQQGRSDFHLYWVGEFGKDESDPQYGSWAKHQEKLADNGLSSFVTFLGSKESVEEYYQAADIFVLTSREDPFPLVVLEAARSGLPIVCFAEAGGAPELVEEDAGIVVPYLDLPRMAESITRLIEDGDLRNQLGTRARQKVLERHTVRVGGKRIGEVIQRVLALKGHRERS